MNRARILFADRDHTLSRIAAAWFERCAPDGLTAASAGFEPQPIGPDLSSLFEELGFKPPDPRPVSLSDVQKKHFDLTVTIGPERLETCALLPGGLLCVHWKMDGSHSNDRASLRNLGRFIEGAVKHLFSDGYYDALLRRSAAFENIFDSLSEGIMAHRHDRRIFYFSRGAEKITGAKRESVIGRDCHEFFTPRLCGESCLFCDSCNADGIKRSTHKVVFTTDDGTRKELELTRFPLKDEDGRVTGVILALSDQTRLRQLEEKLGETYSFSGIIGNDHSMHVVYELIRDIAGSDFPVVVTGESGTGKELVAAAIHGESNRRDKLFVPVNCGALPEGILESELFGHVRGAFTGAIRDKKGRFELADKGTLFLDEIAELTPRMQVKLLRVLQEGVFEPVGGETPKKVDVRVICATNRNLKDLVSKGAFRDDLYYRLAVMPIHVPPLRERRNDIALLARHFLEQNAAKLSRKEISLSNDALSMLMNYAWPGNVRQLQNTIQFALIKCRTHEILPGHLPPEIAGAMPPPHLEGKTPGRAGRKPKLAQDAVERALEKTGGNKAKAARYLGVGRATLYNFLGEHTEIKVKE